MDIYLFIYFNFVLYGCERIEQNKHGSFTRLGELIEFKGVVHC